MPMDFNLVDAAEFGRLREEWNQLLRKSLSDNVFLRWEWMHTWWCVFGTNRRLFILSARQKGVLVGLAPLYIENSGPLGTKYLKLLSEELFPDYLDVIVQKGFESDFVAGFYKFLSIHSRDWDILAFDHMTPDAVFLSHSSVSMDYYQSLAPSHLCPYIKIEGTFDHYFREHHELSRFSLKKKQRKIFEDQKVSLRVVNDETSLRKGLEDLFLLHQKRTNQRHLNTNFLSPRVIQFHNELARLFLSEGILNLQLLYNGETAISAHYCFTYNNKTYYYQSGFDPIWSKLSVGMVQLFVEVQQAFREGRIEFDLLKGNEDYKSLWSNAVREEMRFTVYNKSLRGSALWAYQTLKTFLRVKNRLQVGTSSSNAVKPRAAAA